MTQTQDYLDADPEIPEQRFALLSLVLPESVVEKREVFYVQEFLRKKLETLGLTEEQARELQNEYQDFKYVNHKELLDKFSAENGYENNLAALKVRGIYQTQEEAKQRAQRLQRGDPHFHIFCADVGKWLPIFPSLEAQIDNQEYGEKQLNDLIGGYKKNQLERDILFEKNKNDRVSAAHLDVQMRKKDLNTSPSDRAGPSSSG